jgi:hypothetical protein
MHKPISSSASSTSSQETKHRRSTSMTRSCASAPVTPLKSSIPLDFSDSEEYFPGVAGASQRSSSARPLTLTDNEGEPNRARTRGIKDHSSRRILFNHALRNPPLNTRPVPSPVKTLDSPHCLLDIESVRSSTNTERTATVFTTEPEDIPNPDNTISPTAPRVRKPTSWKSKLFSKARTVSTEETTADAEVSPTPTPYTLVDQRKGE